jgi:protein SCO1/2
MTQGANTGRRERVKSIVIEQPGLRGCAAARESFMVDFRNGSRAAAQPRSKAWNIVVLALVLLPACTRKETPASAAPPVSAAPADAERHFPITGEILAVNADRRTLTILHDDIKGLMPAMTMEFGVSAGDLAIAKKGMRIRADLIQRGPDFCIEKIWPDDPDAARTVAMGALALKQDTVIRGSKAYREVGETLPDFTLYDQDGRVVQINRFRGKQVVLNFIFTRCPVANMCPAATAKMMALQEAARQAGVNNLELISVTLDPTFDTPGVLKNYATARGIDTRNFSFLTGPESAIKDLLTQMGVLAFFEDGLLKHSLATLLINQDGKIIWREDGSVWSPDVFLGRMRKE